MGEISALMEWTFIRETNVPDQIQEVLVEGEIAEAAYKTIRDTAVITNKRIIIADKQRLGGRKIEIYTIPFKSILLYSTENAKGLLDVNSELQIWTEVGSFKLNLRRGIDIRKIDRLIGEHIL